MTRGTSWPRAWAVPTQRRQALRSSEPSGAGPLPYPAASPSPAGSCRARYCLVILPSLNGPRSTSHEYLSFPLLLCLPDECLAADTEVATGQCRIAVSCVVVHPLQPLLGQPADLPHPAYVLGTRSSRSYYFHDDTILSVTLHYEREHHDRSPWTGVREQP